jgi:hypothetical protein
VVGAKDERHGVEQEDGRLGLVGHEMSVAGKRDRGAVIMIIAQQIPQECRIL